MNIIILIFSFLSAFMVLEAKPSKSDSLTKSADGNGAKRSEDVILKRHLKKVDFSS